MAGIYVLIRHSETGAVRIYHDDYDYEEPFNPYIWEEGNYSCDCNRHLFFHRAVGDEPEEEVPCGESMYRVPAIFQNGRCVYAEQF